MLDKGSILVIWNKNSKIEKLGYSTVNKWGGDHCFHHNKVNLYSLFGQLYRLYGFNREDILNHDKIILFESGGAHLIVDDIRKWNPKASIKYVMRNIVKDYGDWKIEKLKKRNVEIYSFDPGDCEKYGLKPYRYFYMDDVENKNVVPKKDLYFIGKDKGRTDFLKRLNKVLVHNNLLCDFNVVVGKKNKYSVGDSDGIHFLPKSIPYSDVLKNVLDSKAVLEIVQEGQRGVTLRVFEALFFDRKLVTNNRDVMNLPFFKYGNIFVVDDTNIDEVGEFIRKPFCPYDEKIKEEHGFDYFVRSLFENEL